MSSRTYYTYNLCSRYHARWRKKLDAAERDRKRTEKRIRKNILDLAFKSERDKYKGVISREDAQIEEARKNLVLDMYPIVYREKTLFGKELVLGTLHLYEEDGVVYELLTGREYGRFTGSSISSEIMNISLSPAWHTDFDIGHKTPASQVEGYLKGHAAELELMRAAINRKFDEVLRFREEKRKEETGRAQDELERQEAEKLSESWLDSFIDSSR